jgi:hypothetical protein
MLWEVVQQLGAFSIAAGVFAYVGRYTINQYFEKSLNKCQMELDKERLRFSDLHTKRAEVTAELYKKFVEFEEDMRRLTDPMERPDDPPREEKIQQAAESGNQSINYYMKNKIYFLPGICETIEQLNQEYQDIFANSKSNTGSNHRKVSSDRVEGRLELWKRTIEEDIPKLKTELEAHFRELLGVEVED